MAGGRDTSVDWDTKGTAYISCQFSIAGRRTLADTGPVEGASHALAQIKPAARELPGPILAASSTQRTSGVLADTGADWLVDEHAQPVPGPDSTSVDGVAADGTAVNLRDAFE